MDKLVKKWFPGASDDIEVIFYVGVFLIIIVVVTSLVRLVWDDFGRGYGGNPQSSYEEYYEEDY